MTIENAAFDLAYKSPRIGFFDKSTAILKPALQDARHFQLAVLGSLIVFNISALDMGAKPLSFAILLIAVLGTQIFFSALTDNPRIEWRSVLITAFSLTLLLRAPDPGLYALAGFLAVASKYLIRIRGKHLFNPATFAIVALVLTKAGIWVSPGQWGNAAWFAFALAGAGMLVLWRAERMDIAVFFLGTHVALLLARALWLGDPLAIPLHQLQSGSLVLFSFFMITDPRTIPNSRPGRLIFGVAVAVLAHYLAFFDYIRPALYLALAACSLATPLFDWALPANRFQWTRNKQEASR